MDGRETARDGRAAVTWVAVERPGSIETNERIETRI